MMAVYTEEFTEEERNWIDNATLEQLLHKWRFCPIGDTYFQGKRGEYFKDVMVNLKNANPADWVSASKHVGW
jgi:hypothetical protein